VRSGKSTLAASNRSKDVKNEKKKEEGGKREIEKKSAP
jgi:hypothetical protein